MIKFPMLPVAMPLALALALASCTTSPGAEVSNVSATAAVALAKAQSDLTVATNLWGIAAGLAGVAGIQVPASVSALLATAQDAISDANADAPGVEALAQQLVSLANTITAQAAPMIKVVKN